VYFAIISGLIPKLRNTQGEIEMPKNSDSSLTALYQCYVLDPLIEVASALSQDFVQRPRHYRAVPENTATVLDGFRTRTGFGPEWPSSEQRAILAAPVFGAAFHRAAAELTRAAAAFAECRGQGKLEPLEDRVREAAASFRGHLKSVEGRALSATDRDTGAAFRNAIEVFRSKEVANAFGLPPAPGGNWPVGPLSEADTASEDAAYLIEEIQRSLVLSAAVTAQQILLLQRVAHYGGLTIAGVMEDAATRKNADWIGTLVRNAYGWGNALQSPVFINDINVLPRVISQLTLDEEELKSMPTEGGARQPGIEILPRLPGGGGGGPGCTCHTGWTRICDSPTHMASTQQTSCTSGVTFYCDTGPTCTSGFTLRCDKWPVGHIGGFTSPGIGGVFERL
jgi:hypothetical protein